MSSRIYQGGRANCIQIYTTFSLQTTTLTSSATAVKFNLRWSFVLSEAPINHMVICIIRDFRHFLHFIHCHLLHLALTRRTTKTLPKAQRTRGLSSAYQSHLFKSYHKFKKRSCSRLSSESRPRFNFITSTKHQLQNINQTRASKSCLSFKFKPNLLLNI